MERPEFPSEDEQFRLYRRALEHMGDRPVTLRTLDIGGDKQLPYFKTPAGDQSCPGLARAAHPAGVAGPVARSTAGRPARRSRPSRCASCCRWWGRSRTSSLAREIFDGVRASLARPRLRGRAGRARRHDGRGSFGLVRARGPRPSKSISSASARTIWCSTCSPSTATIPGSRSCTSPTHPAVLRALGVGGARRQGQRYTLFSVRRRGERSGDGAAACTALGFDSISVTPHFVPEIKYAVRQTSDGTRLAALAAQALEQSDGPGRARASCPRSGTESTAGSARPKPERRSARRPLTGRKQTPMALAKLAVLGKMPDRGEERRKEHECNGSTGETNALTSRVEVVGPNKKSHY